MQIASGMLSSFSRNNIWVSFDAAQTGNFYIWDGKGDPSWKTDIDYDGFSWDRYLYRWWEGGDPGAQCDPLDPNYPINCLTARL